MDALLGFLGREIGSGCYRRVFEAGWDDSLVVKMETSSSYFANVAEWDIWHNLKGTPAGKFLCPCVSISPGGGFLIMKKAGPVKPEQMPKRIPGWCADVKIENWGWFDGRPVMLDYANHRFFTVGLKSRERRVRKWNASGHADLFAA